MSVLCVVAGADSKELVIRFWTQGSSINRTWTRNSARKTVNSHAMLRPEEVTFPASDVLTASESGTYAGAARHSHPRTKTLPQAA
jgi:hypothetical protein